MIGPEYNLCADWLDLAQTVTENRQNRLKAAQEWLANIGKGYFVPLLPSELLDQESRAGPDNSQQPESRNGSR